VTCDGQDDESLSRCQARLVACGGRAGEQARRSDFLLEIENRVARLLLFVPLTQRQRFKLEIEDGEGFKFQGSARRRLPAGELQPRSGAYQTVLGLV
jgi:hypothetical protein